MMLLFMLVVAVFYVDIVVVSIPCVAAVAVIRVVMSTALC